MDTEFTNQWISLIVLGIIKVEVSHRQNISDSERRKSYEILFGKDGKVNFPNMKRIGKD